MTWGANALSAVKTRLSRCVSPASTASYPPESVEASPIAAPTRQTPSRDVMLASRAQRVSNRNRKQAAVYLKTHQALNSNSFEG